MWDSKRLAFCSLLSLFDSPRAAREEQEANECVCFQIKPYLQQTAPENCLGPWYKNVSLIRSEDGWKELSKETWKRLLEASVDCRSSEQPRAVQQWEATWKEQRDAQSKCVFWFSGIKASFLHTLSLGRIPSFCKLKMTGICIPRHPACSGRQAS